MNILNFKIINEKDGKIYILNFAVEFIKEFRKLFRSKIIELKSFSTTTILHKYFIMSHECGKLI